MWFDLKATGQKLIKDWLYLKVIKVKHKSGFIKDYSGLRKNRIIQLCPQSI